jgi:hypothetical protein
MLVACRLAGLSALMTRMFMIQSLSGDPGIEKSASLRADAMTTWRTAVAAALQSLRLRHFARSGFGNVTTPS